MNRCTMPILDIEQQEKSNFQKSKPLLAKIMFANLFSSQIQFSDYDATTLGMRMQIHQPHKIRHRVHPKSNMTTTQVFCKVLESLV